MNYDFELDYMFWCDRDFVPVGARGIFGNSLHDVYAKVKTSPDRFSAVLIGKKDGEACNTEKVFQKENGRWYSYFFLLELPVQDGYREYTKEEAEKLIGRKFFDLTEPEHLYEVSCVYESEVDGENVVYIEDVPVDEFLRDYRWEDGRFCGVKI